MIPPQKAFSDVKKIIWYDLSEELQYESHTLRLISLALFLPLIGHIARYAPSSSEKNGSKI